MLDINSEHTSSENQFERKFQAKIYQYDQIFEKQEEEFIKFKGEQKCNQKVFIRTHSKDSLTLTSETLSYEDCI